MINYASAERLGWRQRQSWICDMERNIVQDSWFRKAEGESGTEECTGRAEAGDDLQLYTAVQSVFKAVVELALRGDLILM